ncbi:MAG: branched-chain amino acid ABC transporter permease [Candidatus Lokiarchaeota archaeon]|nr:branched-chain amino acid ABC transporter permease [Candidatus Lokiarchaeota archaeon]
MFFQAEFFVDTLVYGAALGSVLALLALGYSLVYGVGGIINLAHGAFYILTGYIVFWAYDTGIVPYPIAIILGLLIVPTIAAISYIALIKPTQEHEVGVLIITFSLGFLIERSIVLYEGMQLAEIQDRSFPPILPDLIDVLGTPIISQYILIMIVAVVIISCLIIFIKKSKLGKSIRAVSQDKEAAQLMGINVNLILMFTIVLSAFLAGIAAVLYVPVIPILPTSGWEYLLMSMSVVILGGLGSLPGSVIGAFVISYARFITFYYIDIQYQLAYSGVIHLVVIVIMLIVRPRGILGKKQRT